MNLQEPFGWNAVPTNMDKQEGFFKTLQALATTSPVCHAIREGAETPCHDPLWGAIDTPGDPA